jgi:hypothetical protein
MYPVSGTPWMKSFMVAFPGEAAGQDLRVAEDVDAERKTQKRLSQSGHLFDPAGSAPDRSIP